MRPFQRGAKRISLFPPCLVERIQARKAPYQPVLVKILGPEKLRVQGVLEPVGPGVITNTGTQAHIQCTHCGVCVCVGGVLLVATLKRI